MSTGEMRSAPSQTKSKLWVDIIIFIVFLITMAPHLSGLPVHEWLSLSMIFGMTVHLLINWDWVIRVSRRFFGGLNMQTRVNYVLNWLFFIGGTLIMISGIMISEVAIPSLGLNLVGRGWYKLHELSTDAVLILLGIHTALHWGWIVSTFSRYLIQPVLKLFVARDRRDTAA
ncbi:MAG: DUF4405 domain-containing protein [Anaerolineales bacterium]|nr:DUF4405 domain-containing protein [Anaerolineales bacterium]